MDTRSKLHQKLLTEFNRDFEHIILSSQKSADTDLDDKLNYHISSVINRHLLKRFCLKLIAYSAVAFGICSLVYYVQLLNWNASAIGRIVMIKLLRYWDWQYLYNSNCLISAPKKPLDNDVGYLIDDDVGEYCESCENLSNFFSLISIFFFFLTTFV